MMDDDPKLDLPPRPDPVPLPPLLDDARRIAFEELHRRLEAEGHTQVRDAHGCVFRYIDGPGSRLTQLAERSGFTKQAVGEFVDDLERIGYVERVPDPRDGRAKIIRLTGRGADARRAALRIFAEIEREWAQRLGAERVGTLRAVLEEIASGDGGSASGTRSGDGSTAATRSGPAPAR